MKNYYCLFMRVTNFFLVGILGVLGISCEQGADEYGTPYATYSVKGKVLEAGNTTPVPNIRVIVRYNTDNIQPDDPGIIWCYGPYNDDVVYTNEKGEFSSSMHVWADKEAAILITGEENIDPFIPDTSEVSFKDVPFKNGKGWDKGTVTKEITIYLEKKKDE